MFVLFIVLSPVSRTQHTVISKYLMNEQMLSILCGLNEIMNKAVVCPYNTPATHEY